MSSIPHIDMHFFQSDFSKFCQTLGEGYQENGFVALVNHGIDDQIIHDALNSSKIFFELDDALKLQYLQEGTGRARGYTPFGQEIAKGASHHDLKEFWHIGRELSTTPPYPALYPNIWPKEIPEFKEKMLALYQTLDQLGNQVLEGLAHFLEQPRDYFKNRTNFGNSILRALHYPPVQHAEPGSVRAAAHEDINVITLLVGSKEAGLEVLNKQNEWVPISIIEGAIICNIGDMLQRLSNHVLPSTTHRVVNPQGEAAKYSRYSIPFFLHFNPDVMIEPLESCTSADNPNRYAPITANEYLLERLREIGLFT